MGLDNIDSKVRSRGITPTERREEAPARGEARSTPSSGFVKEAPNAGLQRLGASNAGAFKGIFSASASTVPTAVMQAYLRVASNPSGARDADFRAINEGLRAMGLA